MQLLSALLAFAAVMALLSTIIAVGIEAFISANGMRRRGLERLLAGYYRSAVAPRLPAQARPTTDADLNRAANAFASAMTRNPARLGRSGRGGGGRYQHLTTRQLVEQLARTPAGEALLKLNDRDLARHLEALAYEFDRFGEGARTFFTRRTRIFSILLAMVFAFGLNVDALRLFKVLSTDASTREAIILWADAEIARRDGVAAAPTAETPPVEADEEPTLVENTDDDDEEAVDPATVELSNLISLLGTLSIPVGYSQYPYCLQYSPLHGEVKPGDVVFDPRCERVRARTVTYTALESQPTRQSLQAERRAESNQPEWALWLAERGEGVFGFVPPIYHSRIHFDTWVWFFSTLVAGGMIGLGGPFWFNVYRSLAALIPVVGAAQAVASQFKSRPTPEGQAPPTTTPSRREDENVRDGTQLVVVARTSNGESPETPTTQGAAGPNVSGHSPPGTAMGAGSAQRVAAAGGAGAPFRVRRVRG